MKGASGGGIFGGNVGPFPKNFARYFAPGTVYQCCQSEVGIASSSSAVTAWAPTAGGGYVGATGAQRPTLSAGINGYPGITFDGVANILTAPAVNMPDPTIDPWWIGIVFRLLTWTANARVVSDVGTDLSGVLLCAPAPSPKLSMYNGSFGGNSSLALGTWECTDGFVAGGAPDYLKRGLNAPASGAIGLLVGSGGRVLGGNIGGYSNIEVAHIIYAKNPSPQRRANWRAGCGIKYAGVSF